jgi:Raf kinase inhibitor-like YbhB/YbcL family protein
MNISPGTVRMKSACPGQEFIPYPEMIIGDRIMEALRVKISVKVLPNNYTCDGEDISPEIDVGGVNTAISKSLAIIVNDPDAGGGGGFVHWIAWNVELVKMIPEKIPNTPEVTFPLTAIQGTNSFGNIGYNGPCPPHGQTHRYFFKIYGLDSQLSLPAGSTKDQLAKAMEGHVVQYGETYVTYGR